MNKEKLFRNSTCEDQIKMAERELSAFVHAVTDLFGPEQARISAEDWLDELDRMNSPPRSTGRDWRALTVAASAGLAKRLSVGQQGASLVTPANTNVPPILSSNCVFSTGLV